MRCSVALLGLGPDFLDRLVADAAVRTFLNRLLQCPELRVAFLVTPDQVAEVCAVAAALSTIDLSALRQRSSSSASIDSGLTCRTSFPFTRKTTYSAMFLE